MTLTEFLLARIGEDEADARKAVDDDESWRHEGEGVLTQYSVSGGHEISSGWLSMGHRFEAGDHIARHNPARVLAECEAKRSIVAEHTRPGWTVTCPRCLGDQPELASGTAWRAAPCPTLRALALPYADHPDYREEWRP